MAAPISSYDLLKSLSDSNNWREYWDMNEALKRFNLLAFIIHDPEEHSDFDREMGRIFDRLDYLTGEKLLFFTLIDPPEEWLRHGRQREYMKYLGYGKALVLPNPENTITSTDKELTAFSLAKSLNIPVEMLPCIVITHDFRSSDFVWVRTCTDHIREQLENLGYLASRGQDLPILLSPVQEEIDLCEGSGTESLEDSLAQALTDVLSFIIDSNNPEVEQQAVETINNLQQTLQKIKRQIRDEQNPQSIHWENQLLDSLCEKIVVFLAHRNTQPTQDLANFISIDTLGLEVDSCIILKTAHMVNDFLMNAPTRMIDYTPVVICLSKVFEREINLSVVHWIRQTLGVQLPNYFNKHQKKVNAVFNPRDPNRAIDFNKSAPGNKWQPPAIGESQIAYSQMAQHIINWLDRPQIFLSNWETIRQVRNQAAHTQYVDERSVNTIRQALNQLAGAQIFQTLFDMKTAGRKTGFQLNP